MTTENTEGPDRAVQAFAAYLRQRKASAGIERMDPDAVETLRTAFAAGYRAALRDRAAVCEECLGRGTVTHWCGDAPMCGNDVPCPECTKVKP